jgi:hypothetical protein
MTQVNGTAPPVPAEAAGSVKADVAEVKGRVRR